MDEQSVVYTVCVFVLSRGRRLTVWLTGGRSSVWFVGPQTN